MGCHILVIFILRISKFKRSAISGLASVPARFRRNPFLPPLIDFRSRVRSSPDFLTRMRSSADHVSRTVTRLKQRTVQNSGNRRDLSRFRPDHFAHSNSDRPNSVVRIFFKRLGPRTSQNSGPYKVSPTRSIISIAGPCGIIFVLPR